MLSGPVGCGTISLPDCSISQFRPGAAAGVGVEYGFTPNWSANLEYIWAGAIAGSSTESISMVRVGVNYRFGG